MRKSLPVLLVVLGVMSVAAAQIQPPTSDVLGAHLNYGRGCAACHAPHSGASGNGANKSGDAHAGEDALWGQDVGNLYGKTITFGWTDHGPWTETMPTSLQAGTPDVLGIMTCLSCHDGNYAQGAMMKNQVFETLPASYGTFNKIPTLLGQDGNSAGDYLNDHPVGLNATVSCGGQYNWDCTETAGVIAMNGPNSSAFVKNYGWFVQLNAYNNTAVVTCTSCHNQHVMNTVNVQNGPNTGLPSGYYATMFFVRGPYNPASGTAGSNQTAQFCRQCHGGEANESNGSYNVPTTF
jgi:hypothetical protein